MCVCVCACVCLCVCMCVHMCICICVHMCVCYVCWWCSECATQGLYTLSMGSTLEVPWEFVLKSFCNYSGIENKNHLFWRFKWSSLCTERKINNFYATYNYKCPMKVLGTKTEIILGTLVSRNTGHFPEITQSKVFNLWLRLHSAQQMSSLTASHLSSVKFLLLRITYYFTRNNYFLTSPANQQALFFLIKILVIQSQLIPSDFFFSLFISRVLV